MNGPSPASIYITSDKGTLTLPASDGRTIAMNGFGAKALYSDGAEQLIGGYGPITPALGNTLLSLSLDPGSGTSTDATATILQPSATLAWPKPTGTVQFTVNGEPVGNPVEVINETGQATLTLNGSNAFPDPGTYNVGFIYSGDENYGSLAFNQDGSQPTGIFAFN